MPPDDNSKARDASNASRVFFSLINCLQTVGLDVSSPGNTTLPNDDKRKPEMRLGPPVCFFPFTYCILTKLHLHRLRVIRGTQQRQNGSEKSFRTATTSTTTTMARGTSVATKKIGPNDARRVIQALSEIFFLIVSY